MCRSGRLRAVRTEPPVWGCGDKEGRLPQALEEDSGAVQVTRAYCFTSRAARTAPGIRDEAGPGAGATAAQ